MNILKNDKFFVITGGPGSGKTSIVLQLATLGYNVVPEGARQIIKQQMETYGDAVPWNNVKRFRKLCLDYALQSFKEAQKVDQVTFFDCDLLELLAYNKLASMQNSQELLDAAQKLKYNKNVFITEPWQEIFHKDAERRQTFEQAIEIYNEVSKQFIKYGYNLIEIPKIDIEQRAEFVIEKVKGIISTHSTHSA